MNTKKSKLIITSVCVFSLMGLFNNSFATEKSVIETSSPIIAEGLQNVTVLANQGSVFSITIPKKISLDNTTRGNSQSSYTIEIRGDIASDEILSVVPDKSFIMNQSGGRTFTVSTTQNVTTAIWNEITETNPKIITGSLTGKNMTSGSWVGSFNFNISLEKITC